MLKVEVLNWWQVLYRACRPTLYCRRFLGALPFLKSDLVQMEVFDCWPETWQYLHTKPQYQKMSVTPLTLCRTRPTHSTNLQKTTKRGQFLRRGRSYKIEIEHRQSSDEHRRQNYFRLNFDLDLNFADPFLAPLLSRLLGSNSVNLYLGQPNRPERKRCNGQGSLVCNARHMIIFRTRCTACSTDV